MCKDIDVQIREAFVLGASHELWETYAQRSSSAFPEAITQVPYAARVDAKSLLQNCEREPGELISVVERRAGERVNDPITVLDIAEESGRAAARAATGKHSPAPGEPVPSGTFDPKATRFVASRAAGPPTHDPQS